MAEKEIQAEIIRYLKLRKDIIFWRNNTGAKNGGKLKFGEPGAPDIFVVFPKHTNHGKPIGALVAIEVKGQKGKMSESQEAWQKKYSYFGVQYRVVRSVEDVEIFLEEVKLI